jgi:hypothetical protein
MLNDVLSEIIKQINLANEKIQESPNIVEQTLIYVSVLNSVAGLAKGALCMSKEEEK